MGRPAEYQNVVLWDKCRGPSDISGVICNQQNYPIRIVVYPRAATIFCIFWKRVRFYTDNSKHAREGLFARAELGLYSRSRLLQTVLQRRLSSGAACPFAHDTSRRPSHRSCS